MNLRLVRYDQTEEFTRGLLMDPDGLLCYTLEPPVGHDPPRAIPEGFYAIGLRHTSPMANHYDDLFTGHQGMLWLQDVPGFTYIYLHIGNTVKDTMGCILVGDTAYASPGFIGNSQRAYAVLYGLMRHYAASRDLFIQVTAPCDRRGAWQVMKDWYKAKVGALREAEELYAEMEAER